MISRKAKIFNTIAYLLSNNYKVIEQTLIQELKPTDKTCILDLGCGTGRFARNFPNADYTGIDSNREYIFYARQHHNKRFEEMDARNLKFPERLFSNVFSVGLFHHLNDEDALKVSSEVKRVLIEDGDFFVIDAIWPSSCRNIAGFILRKLDRGRYIRREEEYTLLFERYFNIQKRYIKKYGVLEFIFLLLRKK